MGVTVKVRHPILPVDEVDLALGRAVLARDACYDTIHQALEEIDQISEAIDRLLDQRPRTSEIV